MLSKRSIVTVADGDKANLFPNRCSGGPVRMRVFSVWAATVAAGIAWGASPTKADDTQVAAGHALVQMYCTDCHATERVGDSPFPTAPKFRDLHLRYDVEVLGEALVEGIVTAHPEMPQFEFDPDQAQAIIEYLKSLESVEPDWGLPDPRDQAGTKNDER